MDLLKRRYGNLYFACVCATIVIACSKKDSAVPPEIPVPTPVINSFAPLKSYEEDTILITGSNFAADKLLDTVMFNGVKAHIVEATSTTLKVIVPLGSSTGKLSVKVGDKTGTSAGDFIVTPLVVESITAVLINTPEPLHHTGPYSTWISAVGNSIYFANPSNTTLAQYFDRYNIATNNFEALSPSVQLCGCGGGSSYLVSDSTNLHYFIDGYDHKYDVANNIWQSSKLPSAGSDIKGGEALAYMDGKVWFAGNDESKKKFRIYDIGRGTVTVGPEFPNPIAYNSFVSTAGGKFFVFLGQTVTAYDTAAKKWIARKDHSLNFYNNLNRAVLKNRLIFVRSATDLLVYDSFEDKWRTFASLIPSDANNAYSSTLISIGEKLYYVAVGANAELKVKIYELKVTYKQ